MTTPDTLPFHCARAGVLVWLAALAWLHPSPFETAWAHQLLLLAALVLVPLVLGLEQPADREGWEGQAWWLATAGQTPAALALAASFAWPAGWAAGLLALPWLLETGLVALVGALRLARRGRGPLAEVSTAAGLLYLAVGGVWTVLTRLDARPLAFEPVIVLLTAIHFHYAGLVLPVLTGRVGRVLPGPTSRLAAVGVVAGVPLVAVGITATQVGAPPLLEGLAAWLTAAAGTLTAWLHLRLAGQPGRPRLARGLEAVAGLALLGGMVLAALYGSRAYLRLVWLDVPWMRALHGSANALGFALPGLLAWSLDQRPAE